MTVSITVDVDGPIFNDRLVDDVIDDMLRDAADDVGAQGLSYWHGRLDQVIRHPTPYYETQLTVQRLGSGVVVHDRGIVYGPWLEGTGSRNRTTRFKGYHALRTARQQLERDVLPLTERAVARHIGRLG